jgi:hypothetical protein
VNVIAADKHARVRRDDDERHLFLIQRVLQVFAVAVGKHEIDHGSVNLVAAFQMLERLANKWKGAYDIRSRALQPVCVIECDQKLVFYEHDTPASQVAHFPILLKI